MSTLAVLLAVLLTFVMALGQIRDNHRRGIATNWPKTMVSFVGVLATTAVASAALLWRASLGDGLTGGLLFGFIMLLGITALAVGVNRHWPRTGG